MAGKKGQKQEPKVCDHCGKFFKSGAGVAMHMKWVNGKTHPTKGKILSGSHKKEQQQRMAKARANSPSMRKAGKRITLTCKCGVNFDVVPSAAKIRKYCSKSCLATFTPRKPLSETQKKAISEAQKKRFKENPESNPFYGRTPTNYNGWGHGGYCEELGFHVRSTWERDYLIALKEAAIVFTYEPKRFDLGNGMGTYLPDIQITETDFIEITGWDKPGKAEKRKLFCEVYPDYTLHVINKAPSDQTKQELIDYCKEVVRTL